MSFTDIKRKIEEYDSIVIYRHIRADYDALGSQLGLKYMILANYPEKKVYTAGLDWIENPEFLEKMENPSEEALKKSLAIVLDCSNNERIDGQEFVLGKERIKFDHHTNSTKLSDYDYVDEDATATCIILADFAREMGLKLDKKSSSYLLAGTLTDTQRLTINNVTDKDFELVGFLLKNGAVMNEVYRAVFSNSQNEFIARSNLAAKYKFSGNKAYAVFRNEDYEKYSIPMLKAKEMVDLVREVRGVEQWMLVYQANDGLFNCSLRSHNKPVAPLARKYGGGGHECAAGIPNLTEEKANEVIEEFLKD